MNSSVGGLMVVALAVASAAQAQQGQAGNLKDFKAVCLGASFDEGDKENEAILDKLLDVMYGALNKAGIPVSNSPCLKKGLTGNAQLNLYYTFSTPKDGLSFYSGLEGWLDREGKYTSVTIWTDYFYGTLAKGSGAVEAASALNDLLDSFIADWQSSHKK